MGKIKKKPLEATRLSRGYSPGPALAWDHSWRTSQQSVSKRDGEMPLQPPPAPIAASSSSPNLEAQAVMAMGWWSRREKRGSGNSDCGTFARANVAKFCAIKDIFADTPARRVAPEIKRAHNPELYRNGHFRGDRVVGRCGGERLHDKQGSQLTTHACHWHPTRDRALITQLNSTQLNDTTV